VQTSTQRYRFRHEGEHERVTGWDQKTGWLDTVRNYREKPIRFELQRIWPGDVEFSSEIATTLFDFQTTQATFDVESRSSFRYPAVVVSHHGSNLTQSRVQLR
jgi:hypothetical protein